MAELSRRFSPFVYGNNNPLRFIDPDGMLSKDFISNLWDKSGDNTTWTNNGNGGFEGDNGSAVQAGDDKDKGKKNETSQGPYNHTLYSNISKNKSVFAGYTIGYNKDDKYGSVQRNMTGFRSEYFDYTGTGTSKLAIESGIKATGLQATTTMRAGTESNNLQANVEGNALLGEANLSAGFFSGENNKKGVILGAEAGVYGFSPLLVFHSEKKPLHAVVRCF